MKRIGAMAAVALIALLIALPLGLVAAQGDAPRANVPPAFIFGYAMADGLPYPRGPWSPRWPATRRSVPPPP